MKSMISFFGLFTLITINLFSQQSDFINDSGNNKKLQKVYRYCYVIESKDWYANQEKLWKEEISRNPQNEKAWYNYYFASRYADTNKDDKERKQHLDLLVDKIEKAIPDSYLCPYLRYYNGDYKLENLEKAYQRKPDCADLYWDFILYNEIHMNKSLRKKFCEKLYSSKEIISSLYDYNFNVLNSTEKNSILFSNGDNDTYPIWILQDVKNVRSDVTLLNIHTVFVLRDYLKKKLDERGLAINLDNLSKDNIGFFFKELILDIKKKYPEISIHIAPTVYQDYIKEVNDKLYLTGLDYTYSENQVENIPLIKKNLEQNVRLNYLDYDWYNEKHISQKLMDRYNLNYIPPFIELAKMYFSNGDFGLSKYWQDKAMHLAQKVNDDDLIQKIKELKW